MKGGDWVGLIVAVLIVFVIPAMRRNSNARKEAQVQNMLSRTKPGDWRADALQPLRQRPGKLRAVIWTLLMPWLMIPAWVVGLGARAVAKRAARRSLIRDANLRQWRS